MISYLYYNLAIINKSYIIKNTRKGL